MVTKSGKSATAKSSFFIENKPLIIGGVFLILIVIIAAGMFTRAPDRLVGQFTKTAEYQGVEANFHGLEEVWDVDHPFVSENEGFSLYLGVNTEIDLNALSFEIDYDPAVFSLQDIKGLPGTIPITALEHVALNTVFPLTVSFHIPGTDLQKYFAGDDIIQFDFKAAANARGKSSLVSIKKISMTTIRTVGGVDDQPIEIFKQDDPLNPPPLVIEQRIWVWAPCMDSDNGMDEHIAGTCIDEANPDGLSDACVVAVPAEEAVNEYYCSEGICNMRKIECDLVKGEECINDRCVVPGQSCEDSDVTADYPHGVNIYTYGTATSVVNGVEDKKYDTCKDGTTVIEYYCDPVSKTIVPVEKACTMGRRCVEGACVAPNCGDVKVDTFVNVGDLKPLERSVARRITYAIKTWTPEAGPAFDVAFENADVDLDSRIVAMDLTSFELWLIGTWNFPPECANPMCGDGNLDAGNGEQCDFGDLVNGDGCDDECQIEDPNVFHHGFTYGTETVEFTGDKTVAPAAETVLKIVAKTGGITMNAMTFEINYNHNLFALKTVVPSVGVLNNQHVDFTDPGFADDSVALLVEVPDEGGLPVQKPVSGDILTFTFEAKGNDGDSHDISVTNFVVSTIDGANQPVTAFKHDGVVFTQEIRIVAPT